MNQGVSVFWPLLLQAVLILVNAVFACAEIAVISINDNKLAKLAESGDKRAIRLVALTEQPAHFLATIQVGITLAGFLGSAFAAGNFSGLMAAWLRNLGVALPYATLDAISVVAITLVLSYFTLIFGELVPKRIAMKKAEAFGLAMSGLIYFVSKLFKPIVWLLTATTNAVLRLVGIDPGSEDAAVTEEEILMMLDIGSEKGTIDLDEREFIHKVFEFDNLTAQDVMTHRTDVALLWLEQGDEEWERIVYEGSHSVYPVCDEDTDDVVGVLRTRDYFRLRDRSREVVMGRAVKTPYFVPETVRTDILLQNMQKTRNHFAIVLDEYGGMSGIVTMNDLLEQLVGEIEDDTAQPSEEAPIVAIGPGRWRVKGYASVEAVGKELGVELPEECETFGGFVFGEIGSVPEDGSTPALDTHDMHIEVAEIREHRLETALVTVPVVEGASPSHKG